MSEDLRGDDFHVLVRVDVNDIVGREILLKARVELRKLRLESVVVIDLFARGALVPAVRGDLGGHV